MSGIDAQIQELVKCEKKLKLAKALRFILIGFLFVKKAESRKVELTLRIEKQVLERLSEVDKMAVAIKQSGTYLIHNDKNRFLAMIEKAKTDLAFFTENKTLGPEILAQIKAKIAGYEQLASNYNSDFVKQRKNAYRHLWTKGNISLDDEQQTAIVTDDKYNLVVAAAGSGKTEVLITRIAYLIKRKPDDIEPKRILAIAFQKKAEEQIENRLKYHYGLQEVNVCTFHKLGKDILEHAGKRIDRNDIIDDNRKYGFVKSYVEEQMATNPEFYQLFIRFIKSVNDNEEEAAETDKTAVANYAIERKYVSVNGVKVKSYAEKEIMDYLLTHKINSKPIAVQYEPDMEGFRPDFYIPDLDLFIEHWGIDQNGEVPNWFNQSSQEYRDSMELKKKWFSEHKKLLVETFAYEHNRDDPETFDELLKMRIQKSMEQKFPEKSIVFSPLSYEEILEVVWESQKTPIDDIQNFITIAKTYGSKPERIAQKLAQGKWSDKQLAFGNLALYVFRDYENRLREYGKTDFEDMINEAISALESDSHLCRDIYDHILVDEYQDISEQRLKLLKQLLKHNPMCKLFCVGDDWQSIMGFSGSNLNFFVNFDGYFDNPTVSKICTNYRSIKSIVDAGADLIKNNGTEQVQKPALSKRPEAKPILVLESATQHFEGYCESTISDCIERIEQYLGNGYQPQDILVLTRYMRTKIMGRTKYFQIVEEFSTLASERGLKLAIDNAKEANAVRLLTVHKCKGLEAKVVFVLDVVNGKFGFPSAIEDSELLNVVREYNGIKDKKEEDADSSM